MTGDDLENAVICRKCKYTNPPESPFEFFISLKSNYCKSCNTKFGSKMTTDSDKKIQLGNYRRYLVSVLIPIGLGIAFASLLSIFGFEFEVDGGVFQVLIEVMAIFFGFQILGIFYYLGKVDNQKRDFLQISGRLKQNIEKGTETQEGAKDQALKDISILIERGSSKYDSIEGQLDTWIKLIIFLYGVGISFALFAFIADSLRIQSYLFLIYDITIITVIFISFNIIWKEIRYSLKKMEAISVSLLKFRIGYDQSFHYEI